MAVLALDGKLLDAGSGPDADAPPVAAALVAPVGGAGDLAASDLTAGGRTELVRDVPTDDRQTPGGDGGGPLEPSACGVLGTSSGDLLPHTGTGAAGLGATARGCAVELVASLPRTELEREEPELLYSLITREQAIEPLRYAPEDLVEVQGGPYQLRAEAAEALEELLETAEDEGHPWLVVTSGYRAYDVQAGTHADWVGRVGRDRASVVSAVAGHSEHQLGLAVDVGGECGLYDCMKDSEDGRWLAENGHRFGFIVRYPEGGEEVTGYAWEPWHLRYVGPRAAWQMRLTGEAYWEDVQPGLLGDD